MNFGRRLHKLREKAKIGPYTLARLAGSDGGYLRRLENGEKRRLRRETVLQLGQALLNSSGEITLRDINDLLKAAGHGPLPRDRVSIVSVKR